MYGSVIFTVGFSGSVLSARRAARRLLRCQTACRGRLRLRPRLSCLLGLGVRGRLLRCQVRIRLGAIEVQIRFLSVAILGEALGSGDLVVRLLQVLFRLRIAQMLPSSR